MLEVCFGDSVKSSLAAAQNCGQVCGSADAVFTGVKGLSAFFAKRNAVKAFRNRQRELQKAAVSLGGRQEDIGSISFALSEGDIQAPISHLDCPRRKYLFERYCFSLTARCETLDKEKQMVCFQNQWKCWITDLDKLQAGPDSIRIWLDYSPDSQCGLRFVAHLLRDGDTEIHTVDLPDRILSGDNCIVSYSSWCEVEPELFGTFLNREKVLTEAEILELSRQWEKLTEENAPLRVVEDGAVRSAQECYYDDWIRQEFPKDACKIAIVIGNALGKHRLPVGDIFVAERIQHFLQSGELELCSSGKGGFYHALVRIPSKRTQQLL